MSKSLKKLIDINRLREFKNKLVGTDSAYVQTGAVDQTVAGTKTFSKPIVGSVTGSSGSCTGNAATATQFSAKATVALTGDATGTSAGSKKGWSVPVTLANSGVTAGTYGPSADVTGNNNATISVPEITVDAKGRVTSVVNRTLTCKNNTYTVNNATLTIQKNGTNVATFTSNASSNATANITVPTKVSELTNDSGFLTSHQSLSNYVTLNGAQTISGAKTFTGDIIAGAKTFTGDIIGIIKNDSTEDANNLYSTTAGSKLTYYTTSNGSTRLTNIPAAVSTTLESRTIRRLSDSNWVVEQICHNNHGLYYRKGSNGTWGAWKTFAFTDSNISGNAATATTATTAEACTGNAASATKLQTARTINGTSFNGTANITTASWGTARNISITDGTNTSTAVSVNGSADVSLTLPATIKATFVGNVTGNCSGSSGSCTGNAATATTATTAKACTGNAATATKFATARSLWGNNFDGSAAITGAITGTPAIELMPKVTTANNGGFLDFHYNQSTADYTSRIIESASGTLSINNVTITTGKVVTATTFNGALKGNVTGNCSGSSGSCTGNAATATKLATARTINGTAFNGTANITTANWGTARNISIADATATNTGEAVSVNGSAAVTLKLPAAIKANVTGSLTGNAATATKAVSSDSATNASHATSADRASVADHVQSQTSAYHEISFDWDSQVPGYVGLRVDETDMGGIVTTNRLVSDIRAQWYAAYPDGAEAHNAMWGGRDITAAFNNGTVSANIANGTFRDIFPGDYITKAVTIYGNGTPGMTYTVNWVIADCDYWINKGDQNNGIETHHVVIVPQQPIFNANMNATNTTEGGYKGSVMYRSIIRASVTGGIVSAFGSDHILTFRDGISNRVDASVSSGIPQWTGTPGWFGEWVSVQCNLMSEKMVYGAPICAAGAMDNTMATRQMSAFRLSERLINYSRHGWWLRDVVSSASFALVGDSGSAGTNGASSALGVRPFALLV